MRPFLLAFLASSILSLSGTSAQAAQAQTLDITVRETAGLFFLRPVSGGVPIPRRSAFGVEKCLVETTGRNSLGSEHESCTGAALRAVSLEGPHTW
jgi:hypothetical protein